MIIRTRYVGPTNTKLARISAVILSTKKRVIVSVHDKTYYGEPHINAAMHLMEKMRMYTYGVNRFHVIDMPDGDTKLHTNQSMGSNFWDSKANYKAQ